MQLLLWTGIQTSSTSMQMTWSSSSSCLASVSLSSRFWPLYGFRWQSTVKFVRLVLPRRAERKPVVFLSLEALMGRRKKSYLGLNFWSLRQKKKSLFNQSDSWKKSLSSSTTCYIRVMISIIPNQNIYDLYTQRCTDSWNSTEYCCSAYIKRHHVIMCKIKRLWVR